MEPLKSACRDMATNKNIMTFTDIAQAATSGAAMGQKVNSPFIGAVLGVSLEASKRAVKMSEELIKQMTQEEALKVKQAKAKVSKAKATPKPA